MNSDDFEVYTVKGLAENYFRTAVEAPRVLVKNGKKGKVFKDESNYYFEVIEPIPRLKQHLSHVEGNTYFYSCTVEEAKKLFPKVGR